MTQGNQLRVASLFSGVGSFEKALNNLDIEHEVVLFSEIKEHSIISYCTLHDIERDKNYGDVTGINPKELPEFDLMTYGFPCQDITKEGTMEGFKKDSGTRSSLLWNAMDIASVRKPKYMVAENVRSLTYKTYKEDFEDWLEFLDLMGYNTYYKVLNAEEYGIPQRRKRVIIVSIRKDVDDKEFDFDNRLELPEYELDDILRYRRKPEYIMEKDKLDDLISEWGSNYVHVQEATKKGYKKAELGDAINIQFPGSTTRRGRVGKSVVKTLQTTCNQAILTEDGLRKLTPLEYWRLMGFEDEDFWRTKIAIENELYNGMEKTENKMYEMAGNSIVVPLLESVFYNLFNLSQESTQEKVA